MNMELRFNEAELRVNQDGSMTVSGYVNKTMQPSQVLGSTKKFIEKIARGCFQKAIQNAQRDIDFLTEHDDDKILASTRNGSLTLKEDDTGLFMEANITPTSYGKDTYELIKSGILRNMSFGFRVLKDSWRMIEANLFERTVQEMELYEVSVVRDPAYTQSTIAARGVNVIEEAKIPLEILEEADQMEELRKILEALQESVRNLEEQVKELRTLREENKANDEKREEDNKPEDNPENNDNHDEPEKHDEPEQHEEDKKEVEDNKDEHQEEEKKSDEKSEDSKPSEDETEKKDEKKEEDNKANEIFSQLAELKNKLDALRK